MPPKKTQNQLASPFGERIPSYTAPPMTIATRMDDGARTPERSSAKRGAGITQAQKQALIDNLQLEITERARKLRAQYALQAQSLRARLEMRVNRVPQAMRKRKMQDLLDEHNERARPAAPPPVPAKDTVPETTVRKSLKRQSDQIANDDDDKENVPGPDLPVPKKRAKTTTANTKATRTAVTKKSAAPSSVLSPKSHNSRTLPQSPFKSSNLSPEKAAIHRPTTTSPIKPRIAPPVARPASRQTKRPAAAAKREVEGRSSEASNTSAGTTIVTKAKKAPTTAVGKKAAAAKTTAAVGRKGSAVPVAGGGRTLRKRG